MRPPPFRTFFEKIRELHRFHQGRANWFLKMIFNLSQQWNREGCWRDDLSKEEVEHSVGQENGDGEGDLLPRIRGKIEDEHRQERDAHTGDDQVHCVEQIFKAALRSREAFIMLPTLSGVWCPGTFQAL